MKVLLLFISAFFLYYGSFFPRRTPEICWIMNTNHIFSYLHIWYCPITGFSHSLFSHNEFHIFSILTVGNNIFASSPWNKNYKSCHPVKFLGKVNAIAGLIFFLRLLSVSPSVIISFKFSPFVPGHQEIVKEGSPRGSPQSRRTPLHFRFRHFRIFLLFYLRWFRVGPRDSTEHHPKLYALLVYVYLGGSCLWTLPDSVAQNFVFFIWYRMNQKRRSLTYFPCINHANHSNGCFLEMQILSNKQHHFCFTNILEPMCNKNRLQVKEVKWRRKQPTVSSWDSKKIAWGRFPSSPGVFLFDLPIFLPRMMHVSPLGVFLCV